MFKLKDNFLSVWRGVLNLKFYGVKQFIIKIISSIILNSNSALETTCTMIKYKKLEGRRILNW